MTIIFCYNEILVVYVRIATHHMFDRHAVDHYFGYQYFSFRLPKCQRHQLLARLLNLKVKPSQDEFSSMMHLMQVNYHMITLVHPMELCIQPLLEVFENCVWCSIVALCHVIKFMIPMQFLKLILDSNLSLHVF